MRTLIKKLQDGVYNNGYIARRLYPGTPVNSAVTKLYNKIHNVQKRALTEAEIKEIENILK